MDKALSIKPSELVDGVHLWLTRADSIPAESWYEFLSREEHQRADNMGHPRVRQTFVAARAFLRWVLSHYADVSPECWRFIATDHGRPELAQDLRRRWHLRFNVSHTEQLLSCIVSRGPDVGVDVEYLARRSRTDKIAGRFFSKPEVAQLEALPEEERRGRFFDFWTLKEAYIKARGLGLAIPLSRFGFDLTDAPRLEFWTDPSLQDPAENWQFGLFSPPGEEHRTAFAVDLNPPGDPESLAPRSVRCLELLDDLHIRELQPDWIAKTR